MAKSLGYYTYTGVQEVDAGNVLPLVNTIRQYGTCIRLKDNAVVIKSSCDCASRTAGYYRASVNATLTASEEGMVTVSLYQDGNLIPGAVQTSSAAENGVVNFGFTVPLRVFLGQTESKLQLYVNSQKVNTMNVSLMVEKES